MKNIKDMIKSWATIVESEDEESEFWSQRRNSEEKQYEDNKAETARFLKQAVDKSPGHTVFILAEIIGEEGLGRLESRIEEEAMYPEFEKFLKSLKWLIQNSTGEWNTYRKMNKAKDVYESSSKCK